ncbi:ABC transporter ATP-binding protein [Rhodococcus sp. ADH]|uniref:ABC transporter ATP-binding protein n=1 Tax=Nocardiaceae TaxID=85025 RepID=UPI00050C002A|nr:MULTISPECIES: ABC transporter ATP-binding protein [Rhodococcus]KPH20766.1 ABC transporter ATP-binding protein [Rhodococcus sp. ADH]RGP48029.1 ABC transporter ATP-binding protein [Rhodococcus erythropolis]
MRVEYDDVEVAIGGTVIVREITMSIESGRFVGVVGPNGSGKSTLLRCLYRALSPTGGVVRVGGIDNQVVSMRTNALQVAALTQDSPLQFDFTSAEVVATGRLPHGGLFSKGRANDDLVCEDAMIRADAHHLAERSFLSLSGGERQRVLIARAFAQQPSVLVLDEPTNHLDVHHQYAALSAAKTLGVTIVAALHDLNLAAQYCDQLFVLGDGRMVCSGTPAEVITPETLRRWFDIGGHIITHPRLGVPQIIFDEKEN